MNSPHHPDDDRLGLDAFDAVEVPDQWDDIVARADEATSNVVPMRRRQATPWVLAAAAATLIVVAVAALAVRGDGEELPAPATVPGDTISEPDTVAEPDATAPAVTQTTVTESQVVPTTTPSGTVTSPTTTPATIAAPSAAVDAWTPACAEIAASGDVTVPAAPLGPLVALGASPTLDIGLPTFEGYNGTEPPLVSVAEMPGGVLVMARGNVPVDPFGSTAVVAAVEFDGHIRWRRCLDDPGSFGWRIAVADGGDIAVLSSDDFNDGASELLVVDLATGDIDPIDIGERVVVDGAEGWLLAAAHWNRPTVSADDTMLLVEVGADDAATREIPYPDIAVGRSPGDLSYRLQPDPDDGALIAVRSIESSAADAVWTGVAWSSDLLALRRLEQRLVIPFADEGLRLVDEPGNTLWSLPDFRMMGREGFLYLATDDVVVAVECTSWTEENGCQWVGDTPPTERTVGLDRATGAELWSRPGSRPVIELDGGRALMLDDADGDGALDTWRVVDLRTAEPVPGTPTWPSDDRFLNECCGAGDYVWTVAGDGMLIEATYDRLRVWLAPESSRPTAAVDLMG